MSEDGYNKSQTALIKAITMLCKPLIRLMIEKGMPFPQFRDLIKELFVEVADTHFSLDDKKPSDSRIFVLTGVHRKDIKRIRQQDKKQNSTFSSSASLSGEIVARWISMPEYMNENGNPRPLLKSRTNSESDFDQLVSSVNKDVRPKVILEEWLRLNIVHLKDDHVVLNQSAFVTNKEFNEMAYYLGHNIHDHIASCANNILNENTPMFERSVYYASLTENSVNKLRIISDKKSNELLQHLNKQALKLYDEDKFKEDADYRMRLGVYWYQSQYEKNKEQ